MDGPDGVGRPFNMRGVLLLLFSFPVAILPGPLRLSRGTNCTDGQDADAMIADIMERFVPKVAL